MRRFDFFKKCSLPVMVFLAVSVVANAQETSIIPQPNEVKMGDGFFALTQATRIYHNASLKNEAAYLQRSIMEEHGLNLTVDEGKQVNPVGRNIYLLLDILMTEAGALK